jgi:NitT/TauT family transport system ATP-binding protein
VFQEDRLLEHLDAMENLRFILGSSLDQHRALALLERLGLAGVGTKKVREYSGGMKRRLALARALLTEADALALDEPFTGLDEENRARCLDCIREAAQEKPVLLVTHDIAEAVSMSDQVVVLSRRPGRVKSIHDLSALRGLSPMERRDHGDFHRYFNAVWKELDHGG